MTDYTASLSRLEAKIAELQAGREGSPASSFSPAERTVRFFSYRFQALSLAGDLRGCGQLGEAIEAAIDGQSHSADLWLLKARIALKLHRLEDAAASLRKDDSLLRSTAGRLLHADLELQHGRYTPARTALESAVADDPTWDALARLAHLTYVMGDIDAADQLYIAAGDELTAKEMHLFAWLEAQRGFMRFERGQYAHADAHYQRANAAFSGYWFVEQRIAELLGAQGRFAEAIAAHQRLYDTTARPEWAHAIGDLYALSGESAEAHRWRSRAFDQYTASVSGGEVHYFHLFVDLCCEFAGQTGAAVKYARKDAELRSNHTTLGDLAWALYRNGNLPEALKHIENALAFGAVSSRLYLQAACIYGASGHAARSTRYMKEARALNPSPAQARFRAQQPKLRYSVVPASGVSLT